MPYLEKPAQSPPVVVEGERRRTSQIEQSWFRSEAWKVDRAVELDQLPRHEVDQESALLRAATPVLEHMLEDLSDQRLAILLADGAGLTVAVASPVDHGAAVDFVRGRIGHRFTEDAIGTNSIGTVLETRRNVRIQGAEHYNHLLTGFDCVGAPIVNDVTHKVDGVLTICGARSSLNEAHAAYLKYAVRDVRTQLTGLMPRAHLQLLESFRRARRRDEAVVALGGDITLTTPAADAMLDAADHAWLRALPAGGPPGPHLLGSGQEVDLAIESFGTGRSAGVVVRLTPRSRAPSTPVPRGRNVGTSFAARVDRELCEARRTRERVLVTGHRGAGRSRVTLDLAGGRPVVVLDCSTAVRDPALWHERVRAGASAGHISSDVGADELVVLDGIEQLSAEESTRTAELLAGSEAWIAMTSPPIEELGEEHAGLAASCSRHVPIPPLRTRHGEFPQLLESVTNEVCRDGRQRPHWTSAAVALLTGLSWPGNFHELKAAVDHISRHSPQGYVTRESLPPSLRQRPKRALSLLEQSERETIDAALRACDGNKVHAAEFLGISRTTLYKRIRQLEL